jgi:hypothetical protein
MLNSCGMNTENYSRTLIGWANSVSANGNLPSGVTLGATSETYDCVDYVTGATYTNAVAARTYLDLGIPAWTFNGDSQSGSCPSPTPTITPTNTPTPTITPTNTSTPTSTPNPTPSITPSTSSTIFTAKMVAVGGTTTQIAYSLNGFNWSASTSGDNLFTGSIANTVEVNGNGSRWVAGSANGSSNRLIYSNDGINWSASTTGNNIFSREVLGLSWNADRWLAGGSLSDNSGRVAYSNDGITWTGSTTNFGTLIWPYDFATNGGRWVLGTGRNQQGDNTSYYSNDNGVTWSASTNAGNIVAGGMLGVAWGNNVFIGVGSTGDDGGPTSPFFQIGASYDGITWTGVTTLDTTGNNGGLYSIDFDGTKFVAAGNTDNNIVYSFDGFTWSAATNGNTIFTNLVYSVKWNGDQWLAAGQGTNTIAISNDGITWTGSTNGNSIFVLSKSIASKNT